jgi:hypothetical protein
MPAELRVQTNRPENETWYQSRTMRSVLKFVERTLIICGYMALVTAVIFLGLGDLVRAAPFCALGAISVYWTWNKLKRLR